MTALMSAPSEKSASDWIQALSKGKGWVRTGFSNAEGLMIDPSGCKADKGNALSGEELFAALKNAWALHPADGVSYSEFLAPKSTVLDKNHMGTFHQAVGRHLFLNRRTKEQWRWWHDQKFTPDGKHLKPGLYQWVQGHFFSSYFGTMDLRGRKVLDYACGNGFFSQQFKARGAEVLGIDTSAQLIEIARTNWGQGINFMRLEDAISCENYLSSLPASSFDRIYMGDALLFFFYDIKTHQTQGAALDRLLFEFRRLIKPDGTLHLMEPNGTFWLAGWFGSPDRPWTVITEYRHKLYDVAPTIDQVINALGKARFLVSSLIHPKVDPEAKLINPHAHAFAEAFPLWDFYCARPNTAAD
ncbi:MAG: class I SAM-dependent methyltransferase [Nitrospinales bacterium]